MLALKLVRLIEDHSTHLAQTLTDRINHSPRTHSFARIPEQELRERAQEVYSNLGDWLLNKTEVELERYYTRIGARRKAQGVPFDEFAWALIVTKENLWDFLRSEAVAERAMELFGELELLRLLDQFFDRAIYFGLKGYAQSAAAHAG